MLFKKKVTKLSVSQRVLKKLLRAVERLYSIALQAILCASRYSPAESVIGRIATEFNLQALQLSVV